MVGISVGSAHTHSLRAATKNLPQSSYICHLQLKYLLWFSQWINIVDLDVSKGFGSVWHAEFLQKLPVTVSHGNLCSSFYLVNTGIEATLFIILMNYFLQPNKLYQSDKISWKILRVRSKKFRTVQCFQDSTLSNKKSRNYPVVMYGLALKKKNLSNLWQSHSTAVWTCMNMWIP